VVAVASQVTSRTNVVNQKTLSAEHVELKAFPEMCRTNKKVNMIDSTNSHVNNAVEQSSDSEDDEGSTYAFKVGANTPTFPVTVNGTMLNVIIDSGASVNILDTPNFNKLYPKPLLSPSKTKVYPFQSNHPLTTKGEFITTITAGDNKTTGKFIVIDGNGGTLLSRKTAEQLNILRIGPPQTINSISNSPQPQIKLHIDSKIPPIQQLVRRVPWHTRQKVEKELTRLQELDILEKVNEPTTWLNPYVVVPNKPGDQIRLCLDMRQANKAIIRERHVIPKFDTSRTSRC